MPSRPTLRPDRRSMLLAGLGSLLLPSHAGAADGWPESAPAGAPFEEVLAAGEQVPALRAIAVARDGQLVAERFYGGANGRQLLPINSATKSVASMLVGIALAQRKLRSLSQTVGELLPEHAAKMPDAPANAVTLRQILTGTTGLAYDNMRQYRALREAPDPVQFALALPADGRPANSWSYNDAAVGLLTPILERAHGLPLPELARRDLFGPLGIDDLEAARDRAGRVLAYGGLRLKTRDLLKLGWVMADGGRWRGTQVVPADWVAQSTQRQIGGAWPNPPIEGSSGYGYLWFTGTYKGSPVAWAWGYGAQFALLAPSLRLAVATAATEPPPQLLPAQNRAVAALVARILDAAA